MTTQSDILREMSDDSEDQADQIQIQIDQIDASIADYNEKIDAVQNGQCDVAENNLTGYLDGTKVPELEILLGGTLEVVYGADYGTINYTTGGITDFTIIDSLLVVVYEYEGINWDTDAFIQKAIDDFAFGNDYLARPLDSGATYGLIPNRDSLLSAKSILTNNKQKTIDSKASFADYAS